MRPILFTSEMVRAILAGQKTQTRRIVSIQPDQDCYYELKLKDQSLLTIDYNQGDQNPIVKCPYGKPYDILWVRETWQYVDFAGEDNGYVYRATDPDWETMEGWRWKPSIFMPKKACRIFLQVTDVRVEQIQSIKYSDCVAEGMKDSIGHNADLAYRKLWESINGKESWDSNPLVWVVTFSRIVK